MLLDRKTRSITRLAMIATGAIGLTVSLAVGFAAVSTTDRIAQLAFVKKASESLQAIQTQVDNANEALFTLRDLLDCRRPAGHGVRVPIFRRPPARAFPWTARHRMGAARRRSRSRVVRSGHACERPCGLRDLGARQDRSADPGDGQGLLLPHSLSRSGGHRAESPRRRHRLRTGAPQGRAARDRDARARGDTAAATGQRQGDDRWLHELSPGVRQGRRRGRTARRRLRRFRDCAVDREHSLGRLARGYRRLSL